MSIWTAMIHGAATPATPTFRLRIEKGLERLLLWDDRSRARRRLRHMDDRTLRDLGLRRAEALEEARKPFWQA